MNKYLVVDYKIAARYRSNIFGKNFKWPVNHSFYDDTYKNFYDWIYDFPSIIGKNEKLKLIFELVELDLLEYLGNIFGALVDVHLSKKEKLKLAYDKNDSIYNMIINDNFNENHKDRNYKKYLSDFGDNFIQLSRNVYKSNDQRAKIKSDINKMLGSNIKEVKSY